MNIAVVTGASSGIGKEFARLMADAPGVDQIWAVGRKPDRLEALETELGQRIRPVVVDVSDGQAVEEYAAMLARERPEVKYLVNSAGFGKFCAYDEIDLNQSLAMIDTNCKGLVAMTLTTLPYMKRGSRIINMGSQSSFQPVPWINIYGGTKAFVRSYSRALNRELEERGVTVTCVCPGWVRTAFFDIANTHRGPKAVNRYDLLVSPGSVAQKALKDANNGRDMSVYTLWVKIQHLAAKLLPQRVIMNIWMRQQKLGRFEDKANSSGGTKA